MLYVWKLLIILPQSCGDNIRFDTGFQGIKCDTAQHLQEKEEDERWAFSVKISKCISQMEVLWPSYLRLSSLEQSWAVQRFKEVDIARNVP